MNNEITPETSLLVTPVLILGQLPPPLHGSSQMTRLLIETLNSLQIENVFVGKNFSSNIEQIGKFSPRKLIRFLELAFSIYRKVKKSGARKCIFFETTVFPSFIGDWILLYLFKALNVKVYAYLHTFGFLNHPTHPKFKRYLIKYLKMNHHIIVLSSACKDEIVRHGINVDISVIPNAVEQKTMTEFNEKKFFHKPNNKLLFLSNLIPEKGIEDFIKMAQVVSSIDSSFTFTVVGETTDERFKEHLHFQIDKLLLGNSFKFLGQIQGELKFETLRAHDFVIFTSHLCEAQPLVILEAMSQGTPVIAYNVGAISDIVSHTMDGFIVTKGDFHSIAKIATEILPITDQYLTLRRRAYTTVANSYSFEAYSSSWRSLLD